MAYRNRDVALAAAFGWLCGMRSMSGPAVVGRKLLKNGRVGDVLALGAAGEVLLDKHPAAPNRNAPQPLVGRVLMGGVTGAAIVVSGAGWRRNAILRSRRASWPLSDGDTIAAAAVGAVIGGGVAFISTHVTYQWRRLIGERTQLSNAALGAAEDVVVYSVGIALSEALD